MNGLADIFNAAVRGDAAADMGVQKPKRFNTPKPKLNIGIIPPDAPAEPKRAEDTLRVLRPPKVRKRTAAERGIKLPTVARPRRRKGGQGGQGGGPG